MTKLVFINIIWKCILVEEGNKIYYGKPIIYDEDNETTENTMYPNEARLRNMSCNLQFIMILVEFYIFITEDKQGLRGMNNDKKVIKFELKNKYLKFLSCYV